MEVISSAPTLRLNLPDGRDVVIVAGTLPADALRPFGGVPTGAIAIAIDDAVQDLQTPIRRPGTLRFLLPSDPAALNVLRHSVAHILAAAVRKRRPEAKIGFGPAIDGGFYYDFEVGAPFTNDELVEIEDEMRGIAAQAVPFVREEVSIAEARWRFRDDPLKLERLDEFVQGEVISLYTNAPFVDLCYGPHLPDTAAAAHVKLTHTAAAHWRGDSKRQMLQRIYGTAFYNKVELDTHLDRLDQAKRRDHRVLGKRLDLFMFHPFAPGAAFWTERGTTIVNELNQFLRDLQRDGYREIKTPLLYNKALWEKSGHWGKYKSNMFLVLDNETGEHDYSLKPMNCPSHYLMYESKKHSYRELPLRYATYDVLHRNEVSGTLSGLSRLRQFQQDDCHIFAMESQIAEEVQRLTTFILDYYRIFGLASRVKFATRPPERIGTDEMWDRAEGALRMALESTGMEYELKAGDGAFYGPKIDFDVLDSLGRAWQLGTIQLDYAAPERFDLSYVGEDNALHRPVVIHRAVSGSFERFVGILIEHFAGAFPLWLAPEQVRVLPITDSFTKYATEVARHLRDAGLRAQVDERSETLALKIRDGETMKVPFLAVVGAREATSDTVSVRALGASKKQEVLSVTEFAARLSGMVKSRELGSAFEN
jgi:threonyl-tRNA synthetase